MNVRVPHFLGCHVQACGGGQVVPGTRGVSSVRDSVHAHFAPVVGNHLFDFGVDALLHVHRRKIRLWGLWDGRKRVSTRDTTRYSLMYQPRLPHRRSRSLDGSRCDRGSTAVKVLEPRCDVRWEKQLHGVEGMAPPKGVVRLGRRRHAGSDMQCHVVPRLARRGAWTLQVAALQFHMSGRGAAAQQEQLLRDVQHGHYSFPALVS